MRRPTPDEYAPYAERYVSTITETDVAAVLEGQADAYHAALAGLSDEAADARYAEGKWSVREVLGHLIDADVVFGYRMLAVARGEAQNLPGFDENSYEEAAGHGAASIASLAEALVLFRRGFALLLRTMPESAWDHVGQVNGVPVTPRGIAYTMAGHARHHARILTERYGVEVAA